VEVLAVLHVVHVNLKVLAIRHMQVLAAVVHVEVSAALHMQVLAAVVHL